MESCQVGYGRVNVNELDDAFTVVGFGPDAWSTNDEWGTCGLFKQAVLSPKTVFSKVIAMIAPEYDDGVFPKSQAIH